MVQRITYRRQNSYNTRSNRIRAVRTPGTDNPNPKVEDSSHNTSPRKSTLHRPKLSTEKESEVSQDSEESISDNSASVPEGSTDRTEVSSLLRHLETSNRGLSKDSQSILE